MKLMLDQPFLAAAVARLPLIDATDREWCETFATDGYAIYVNRTFAATLTGPQIGFVLAHELMHCVLGHIDRRQQREPRLWNVAIDYATNLLLDSFGFDVLPIALFDNKWRGMSAETIYDRLLEDLAKGDGPTVRTGSGASMSLDEWSTSVKPGRDSHVDPLSGVGDESRPQPFPSEMERRAIRRDFATAMKEAGVHRGTMIDEIERATTSPLAWEGLLANFMGGLRRSDYRLFPPNRKHIHRGLYLPSLGVPGPKHLVVSVDTSGSMSDSTLSQVFSQIDHLRSMTECRLTVIQFDAGIQSVEVWEPFDQPPGVNDHGAIRVSGRGGTDLCAPFKHIDADKDESFGDLDALIVLTDGFGPVPQHAPHYPVLWIMPRGGVDSSGFGTVIRLPE